MPELVATDLSTNKSKGRLLIQVALFLCIDFNFKGRIILLRLDEEKNMFLGYEMPDPQIGKIIPMPPQPIDPCPIPTQPVGPHETYPPNPKWITPR